MGQQTTDFRTESGEAIFPGFEMSFSCELASY